MEYSNQNLQGKSFKGADLQNVNFCGADLRSADFSNANLRGADFSKAKTGMMLRSKIIVFIIALAVSLFSGFIAMLAGTTIQSMLKSDITNYHIAAWVTIAFFAIFIGVAIWKGVFKAIMGVYIILLVLALAAGLFMYFTGLGTGIGALNGFYALLLLAVMFIVGTISRATAGTLASTVLFLVVALGGGMFGKSLGGGIGTVAMALSCAYISKRALKDISNASLLQKIALTISTIFGTSFKNADLTNANFSNAEVKNTNFLKADLTGVNWENTKKLFSLQDND
jgi:hypothetical protein